MALLKVIQLTLLLSWYSRSTNCQRWSKPGHNGVVEAMHIPIVQASIQCVASMHRLSICKCICICYPQKSARTQRQDGMCIMLKRTLGAARPNKNPFHYTLNQGRSVENESYVHVYAPLVLLRPPYTLNHSMACAPDVMFAHSYCCRQ